MLKIKEIFSKTRRPHDAMVQAAKISHLACSGIFFVCGLLIMFVSAFEDSTLFILAGIVNVLIGAASILGYFSNDAYRLAFQSDFALGIFMIIVGSLMIALPDNLFVLLPCAVAIIAIMDGCNKCQISFEGYQFGLHAWFMVLISGLAQLGFGIALIIIATRGTDARTWVGITMAVIGAVNFWTTVYMVRRSARTRRPKVHSPQNTEDRDVQS